MRVHLCHCAIAACYWKEFRLTQMTLAPFTTESQKSSVKQGTIGLEGRYGV